VDSIDIDVLETGAAIELLRRGVSNAAALSDVQWQRIAEWVGHLPLALTLLNAALRRSSISLQKLVTTSSGEGLTQILDAQMDALRPSVPTGVLRGITEAFTLSYELLADGAKVLARRIAWLAAAPISDEFLDVLSKPGSRVQLIDRSFLVQARTQTATRSGWEMHCVLGDFLRSRNQDARQEQLVALAAIRSVCRSLDLDRPRDQILGMGVVVHTRYVLEHLRRMLDVTSTVSNLRDWGTIAVVGFWMGEIGTRLGERTALDASILAYRTASLLARREDAPVEWATTQCSLGTALATLGTQERHEEGLRRLYEATSAYEAALKVSTCERSPVDWATTMHNIGNVLAELGYREENPTHLNNAVSAYQAALEVRTRESRPLEWAATQAALAAVLATLGALEGRPTHCQEAIVAYGAALEVFTRDRVPMEWARIRYNRGNMFKDLGMNEEGTNHLEAAVLEYRAALEVRTRERAPLDWWATQNNLGAVLMELGSRQAGSENLEEALSVFQAALEMRTRECAPLDWALTQFNLGGVFCRLGLRGEGTSHLENAVSAYHAAMQIYAVSSADPMLQLVRDHLDQVETLLRQRRDHA
jgi:tetratricopeptide (TPR) repeat protein